jgi:hypothetical protein
MKPITGQYEFAHQSGIGLDYFTSRLDRLTIYPNGRFLLITQDRSRLSNAAQSLLSGQQVSTAAPETRREGNYILQGNAISFRFDDGSQEQGQVSWNGEGIQIGQNFFNKVSDSTMIPPTQRVKKDMDDIAKGLKIAGTIGGMALKAAKTVHSTIQAVQEAGTGQPNPFTVQQQGQNQAGAAPAQPGQQPQGPYAPPASAQGGPAMPSAYVPPASVQPSASGIRPTPGSAAPVQPVQPVQQPQQPLSPPPASPAPAPAVATRFCDQCGAPARPGKRFCNQCGAELP